MGMRRIIRSDGDDVKTVWDEGNGERREERGERRWEMSLSAHHGRSIISQGCNLASNCPHEASDYTNDFSTNGKYLTGNGCACRITSFVNDMTSDWLVRPVYWRPRSW